LQCLFENIKNALQNAALVMKPFNRKESNVFLSMYGDNSLSTAFSPEISKQCFYHNRSLEISVRKALELHKHVVVAFSVTVLVIDSRERSLEYVPHTYCNRAIEGIWLLLVGFAGSGHAPRQIIRSVDRSLCRRAKCSVDPSTKIQHISSPTFSMLCIWVLGANLVEAHELPDAKRNCVAI
jgi:hypothetical protein